MVVMADVRALGVFQERVKTLLGSLVDILLSEITEAYRETLNMSMNLCEKCSLNNTPESIKQVTNGGLEVMEAALNLSDNPKRLCPPPVQQEARDTNETTLDTAEDEDVTPLILKESKEQEKITHGVEYDAAVKPVENEACEPARSKSSNQELSHCQSQKPASFLLDGGQSTSSMLRELMRPCSVQLQTIPIFERPSRKFYICSFCSKIFMFAKTLKRHKHLHMRERPYSCSHCHKSFNLRKTLLKHKKGMYFSMYFRFLFLLFGLLSVYNPSRLPAFTVLYESRTLTLCPDGPETGNVTIISIMFPFTFWVFKWSF